MMIKIATCLLGLSVFTACQSNSTASRQTLAARTVAANTGATSATEPPPPAEGPEDLGPNRPLDPSRNPSLVPTPLLRENAASHL